MERQIINILSGLIDFSKEIKPELSLRRDLGLTSLSLLGLVGEIEEQFEVHIKESELYSLETVSDLIKFVVGKCPMVFS